MKKRLITVKIWLNREKYFSRNNFYRPLSKIPLVKCMKKILIIQVPDLLLSLSHGIYQRQFLRIRIKFVVPH